MPNTTDQIDSEGSVPSIAAGDTIQLPRWVVYFQGALLGIVAATFFVFGMMVGNLTSGVDDRSDLANDCEVTGTVFSVADGKATPEENAVVIIIPADNKPGERSAAEAMHPDSFEPLDNSGIDEIHRAGGAVVRTNEQGKFNVLIDGSAHYYALIVSAKQEQNESVLLTKKQRAAIGTFFFPVEDVIGNRKFYWREFDVSTSPYAMGAIEFKE